MSPRRRPPSLYEMALADVSKSLNAYAQQNSEILDHMVSYIVATLPLTLRAAIGEYIQELENEALRLPTSSQVKVVLAMKSRKVVMGGSAFEEGVVDRQDSSHVTDLSLQYAGSQERIPRAFMFLSTASSLTHLETVDFFNDRMMDVIAVACRNLYCLSLRNCPVTDNGIIKLCGLNMDLRSCFEQLDKGIPLVAVSPCANSLRELKITMTKVGDPGVAIILLAMKKLTLLRIPDLRISKVFTYLSLLKLNNLSCNLKEFHSREQLDQTKLKVLANICPKLEYIQITFTGKYEFDINIVQELRQMKHLSGAKFANVNSSALQYFIDLFGHQLKRLHLYSYPPKAPNEKMLLSRTQLHGMSRKCRNMENLCLEDYYIENDDMETLTEPFYFKNLKTLKLKSLILKECDLNVFLRKSNEIMDLEISLEIPDLIHDNFLEVLIGEGTWDNLSRLTLLNAHLTSKSLSKLITSCPSLKYLAKINTWLISQSVANDYKQWIHKHNYDVQIY